jgi:hypothetical protein
MRLGFVGVELPNLLELILMGSLLGGTHTLGHLDEARNRNIPMNLTGLGEAFNSQSAINIDKASIHGGGFKRQDIMNRALNNKESSLANALYKLSYLSGLPMMIDKNITRGDINDIKNDVGGFPKEIIAATAIMDLLNSSGRFPNTNLSFTQNRNGTPMIQLNHRF